MNENHLMDRLPVLVTTSEDSATNEQNCLKAGAVDFTPKPFKPTITIPRIKNVYELYELKNSLEEQVEVQTKEIRESNVVLQEQAEKIKAFNDNMTDLLGIVVEYRDMESGEHIQRVATYTRMLGEKMMELYPEYGLTPELIDIITRASVLHDLGKIAISDTILLKPGKLTDEEYEIMKTHTTRGDDLLNEVKRAWDDEFDRVAHDICRHHHERHDGRGYPDGLAGDDIPIAAQLVSVADVYDALTSDRPYKKAFSNDKAVEMILNNECGVFNPKLMDCFEKVVDERCENRNSK